MPNTYGKNRAFEMLMQEKPGFNHYNSGKEGVCNECRTCRFHRPNWRDRSCVYPECPYEPGLKTSKSKDTKGGDNQLISKNES